MIPVSNPYCRVYNPGRWYFVAIAKRECGDANDWPKIYWANRKIIKSPTLVHAG
jgi:hypothetical protein